MIDNPWGSNLDNKNSENEDNNTKESLKKTQENCKVFTKIDQIL